MMECKFLKCQRNRYWKLTSGWIPVATPTSNKCSFSRKHMYLNFSVFFNSARYGSLYNYEQVHALHTISSCLYFFHVYCLPLQISLWPYICHNWNLVLLWKMPSVLLLLQAHMCTGTVIVEQEQGQHSHNKRPFFYIGRAGMSLFSRYGLYKCIGPKLTVFHI